MAKRNYVDLSSSAAGGGPYLLDIHSSLGKDLFIIRQNTCERLQILDFCLDNYISIEISKS